ncbi:uncharacterized protein LOC124930337 [Impatiens glandulifera]|uniref:uncharacterized protein LOC124930337 n=1 Tax=Impatiens glandulifera TaxID=253017 RepID=UPI001FB0D2C6|nr:uncharacterized protein LOC124930337 [Impatiens glandulifera]
MEVFENVLTTFRKNRHYTFHHFCEEEKITHFCFVDDLFVIARADVDTVKTIKDALKLFSDVTVFYGGVNDETKARIQDIMGISEGSFSVRYLGISLTRRQIHVVHCMPLIEKDEGGVGLKNCVEWNRAVTYKHLWALQSKQDSLWVKWVHSQFLKREMSIWTCKITDDIAWSLKKILKLKNNIGSIFDIRIGDGRGTLFWHDP